MIKEYLGVGADNAITGKELAALIGCTIREITAAVERERREGAPICAATGEAPGYYLAADAEELESYCKSLEHRETELNKTRSALLRVLRGYAAVKEETGGAESG